MYAAIASGRNSVGYEIDENFKEVNKHYQFPVMTNQETQLTINQLHSIERAGDNTFEVIFFWLYCLTCCYNLIIADICDIANQLHVFFPSAQLAMLGSSLCDIDTDLRLVLSRCCGLPLSRNLVCFTVTRPRWHGYTDCRERLVAERAKLEMSPNWYRQAHIGVDRHHFFTSILFTPHLTAT